MASKLIKQIDNYDIYQDVDANGVTYTVNAEEAGQTRLVANVDSITVALKMVRVDMMGDR